MFRDVVTQTQSDAELLELAITRNSSHGLQLSQEDKKPMAMTIYNATPERERTEKKKALEKILSVSERTISGWTSRIDKDAKALRNQRIFDDWLACWREWRSRLAWARQRRDRREREPSRRDRRKSPMTRFR